MYRDEQPLAINLIGSLPEFIENKKKKNLIITIINLIATNKSLFHWY